MTDTANPSSQPGSAIPPDDPNRTVALIDRDDPALRHVAVVGDTYTILLSGAETDGRHCLIDRNAPHCEGSGPHRHDFEEMSTILKGEIEFTFRGEITVIKAGMTVDIPANAPHVFTNNEGARARMRCMCTPAGQEEVFLAIGRPVDGLTTPAPTLSGGDRVESMKNAAALAPAYRSEMLRP